MRANEALAVCGLAAAFVLVTFLASFRQDFVYVLRQYPFWIYAGFTVAVAQGAYWTAIWGGLTFTHVGNASNAVLRVITCGLAAPSVLQRVAPFKELMSHVTSIQRWTMDALQDSVNGRHEEQERRAAAVKRKSLLATREVENQRRLRVRALIARLDFSPDGEALLAYCLTATGTSPADAPSALRDIRALLDETTGQNLGPDLALWELAVRLEAEFGPKIFSDAVREVRAKKR